MQKQGDGTKYEHALGGCQDVGLGSKYHDNLPGDTCRTNTFLGSHVPSILILIVDILHEKLKLQFWRRS